MGTPRKKTWIAKANLQQQQKNNKAGGIMLRDVCMYATKLN